MAAGAGCPAKAQERDACVSQTQHLRESQVQHPAADGDVVARLVSMMEVGVTFEIRREQMQVEIGRHPECQIAISDRRVSSKHVRIYRDEAFHYFIEELGANGAWCNNHLMTKGDTRQLHHGDAISICVHHATTDPSPENRPFAAYIFRLTDHMSDPAAVPRLTSTTMSGAPSTALPAPPTSALANPPSAASGASSLAAAASWAVGPGVSKLVTDEWVSINWDMRTSLGSGNFSEVRLGVPVKKLGAEKCAVKVIDKKRFVQFQSKRESRLCLQSEAEMLMSLDNPGIIRFFEWFETEEKLYIAMEYLQGGDLLQFILDNGCFQEAKARSLFSAIAGAVQYLHEKDIVHRDLKPENILLTSKAVEDMRPKLADFGLARKNLKTKDCKTFCGTPHYFAPEVITTFQKREGGQEAGYGKQADMWSLGVILYIMLSGIPPFEEEGLYEQILEGKYEFDVPEWHQVSPEGKELVRQLMHVEPSGRLTIQQTMQHKWFTLQDSQLGGNETGEVVHRVGEVRPPPPVSMDSGSMVKRRRTLNATDTECTTAMAVDSVSKAAGA